MTSSSKVHQMRAWKLRDIRSVSHDLPSHEALNLIQYTSIISTSNACVREMQLVCGICREEFLRTPLISVSLASGTNHKSIIF